MSSIQQSPTRRNGSTSDRRPRTLLDLPREIIRLICKHVYDPMELTQQDRLTWGIYSTVDMHEERQTALLTLKAFGSTCRKVRREARVVLFRCIRTTTLEHVDIALGQGQHFWGRHARCLIVDLSMFDSDADDFPSAALISPPPSHLSASYREPRSFWSESARLAALIQSLPALEHVSFFADASDDSTLSLLWSSLIQHPSKHETPPPTMPPSPSLGPMSPMVSSFANAHNQPILTVPVPLRGGSLSMPVPPASHSHGPGQGVEAGQVRASVSSASDIAAVPGGTTSSSPARIPTTPLASRIRSFGWRQRAAPPKGFKTYCQSSTFASTLHLIRHAYRLSFLVLDADLDEMDGADILVVLKELSLRTAPLGEETELVSLMLCGPIRGWGEALLRDMVVTFEGVKELFFDRPLEKSNSQHQISEYEFLSLVSPLSRLPHLQLLQIGSYTIPTWDQLDIVQRLSISHSSLLVVGLMGAAGETHWWGIWRRASARWASGSGGCPQPTAYNEYPGNSQPCARECERVSEWDRDLEREYANEVGEVAYDARTDIVVAPLEIGHLRILESDAERPRGPGGRRSSILEHRRFSLIDPISRGKRRQSGVAVAPLVPMQMSAGGGKRQRINADERRHARMGEEGGGEGNGDNHDGRIDADYRIGRESAREEGNVRFNHVEYR